MKYLGIKITIIIYTFISGDEVATSRQWPESLSLWSCGVN